jgi:putative spermidine/putrescine transport system ATP-binding protein
VTVVYVTHDQSEALTLSDRVAVFHNGAIQQIDAPEKLYEEPANAFVAHFIGENNRLHGTLLGVEGDTARVRLAEGAQVLARAATRAAVGDAVTVSIRPERVCLAGAQDDCENRVTARIEEFIYLGDHLRLRATVCGNSEFIVKLPIARFAAGSMKVGESLEFGWRAQDARALDPE